MTEPDTDDNQYMSIGSPIKPIQSDRVKKELEVIEQGTGESGSSQDRKSNEIGVRETMTIFKQTTYWGYMILTIVLLLPMFVPDRFYVDPLVQIILIGSVAGSSIAGNIKRITGSKIIDKLGF